MRSHKFEAPVGWALFAWLALGAACASASGGESNADDTGTFTPRYESWDDIMGQVIAPAFEDVMIAEATKDPEDMDLRRIAMAADDAAGHMALGYGALERSDVPRFAVMARDCEQWFRDIGTAARVGEAQRVIQLVTLGQQQHCDRCHDASDD